MAGGAAGALLGGGVLVPVGVVLLDDDEATTPAPGSPGAPTPTSAVLASFERVKVGQLGDLAVGEPSFFDYPYEGTSNMLVRTTEPVRGGLGPDRDVVAFSNQCTHMGCPITVYQADINVLGPCPCHFSSFDISRDGVVGFGQATQNLPRVLLELDGDDLYATGLFRLVYGHGDNLAGEQLVKVTT